MNHSSACQVSKLFKKNSVEYFCETHNTHYSKKTYLLEDHPDINLANIKTINIKKIQESYQSELKEIFQKTNHVKKLSEEIVA